MQKRRGVKLVGIQDINTALESRFTPESPSLMRTDAQSLNGVLECFL